jgi:hypothetical protein
VSTLPLFDRYVMVDWSGGNDTGPRPCKDAIWICEAGGDPLYLRNRLLAEAYLSDLIETALSRGERLAIGFDFPFGYPAGFAAHLVGRPDPLALWDWFEERIEDAPKANNRFDIAGEINRTLPGSGPFWGNGLKRDIDGLPRTKAGYENPFADRRVIETRAKGSFTCWQMAGIGSVGGQVMMGLPVLSRLRRRWPGQVAAWPFEPLDRPVALLEIWPSLTVRDVPGGWIKDAWQVHKVAHDLAGLAPARLASMLHISAPEEGWILGIGQD